MWLAWVAAVPILCAIDLGFGLGPPDFRPTVWDWVLYGGGSVLIVVLCEYLTSSPELPTDATATITSVDELTSDWKILEEWLRSDQPANNDLLGNLRIAQQLAEYLMIQGGTIGLIGPFGGGKTTVIAWIEKEVDRIRRSDQPEIWFAKESCWGFEDSGSAVRQILSRTTEVVGRHADCFMLRSLPESYRKTFSAGGDWLRTLADLVVGSTDPIEQFNHLSEVLESVNARLVLVIEDLDRTTSTRFDRQEVLALLQRLRVPSKRISFILATAQTSAANIDFAKLCDRMEILPDFGADRVASLIEAVRSRCQNEFPLVGVIGDENPWSHTRTALLSRFDMVTLPDAAARLLRTPRALKHALRRTYQAWQVLYGEIDLDHLLALNVLRHGAPEAFDFLLRHWGQLHDDPRTWQSGQEHLGAIQRRLTEEWNLVTRQAGWDVRAGMAMLTFLLPSAGEYLGEQRGIDQRRLQGICDHRYWLRGINEEIDSSEARDQTVLQDIANWRASPNANSPLIVGLCASDDYVSVWERFARGSFSSDAALPLVLADQLIERFRTPYGARIHVANGRVDPASAFIAIWRYANRNLQRGEEAHNWLERQVRLAMPMSLALVNDLYYYWASAQYGIIRPEVRAYIRRVIFEVARGELRTGEDLLRVSHPEFAYGIYQLVFPPDSEEEVSEYRGLPHWEWLGRIMIEALRTNPARLARDIGHLISNRRRADPPTIDTFEVDRDLLTGFFGTAASEAINLIASARNSFSGVDRSFLEQIIHSAGS